MNTWLCESTATPDTCPSTKPSGSCGQPCTTAYASFGCGVCAKAVHEQNNAALNADRTITRRNMSRLREDGASIQKKTSSCPRSARTLGIQRPERAFVCCLQERLLVALVSGRLRRSDRLLVEIEAHLL